MLVTLISYCSHRWFELPTRRWMIARVSAIGRGGRPQQRVAEVGR
jgi:peptidoglycan/LPS O-acetylase OafA/YrhL